MNMNVNLNSFLSNIPENVIITNKLSGSDKSSFMNMLAMMIGSKSDLQNPSGNSEVNLNFLELLTGSNNMNVKNLSDVNATNTEVFNKIISDKQEKKEDDNSEELVNLQNYLNIVASSFIKTEPQFLTENLTEILNTGYVQALKPSSMNFNSQNGLKKEDHGIMQNIISGGEMIKMASITDTEAGKISPLETSAEKLITEIQDQIDGQKNKTNLQTEILTTDNTFAQEQNTIIKVSDESSLLKPKVLSQIKDKIVFMSEEGPEPGNTTKHVTMELHPVSLGKVDIKMTFENNKITVEIKAMNEETQKLISSNSNELAKILGKTSESVNIIVKSNELHFEHQVYNYNHSEQKNEQGFNQDDQNYGHGRQKKQPLLS